jgi:hypothetical protein
LVFSTYLGGTDYDGLFAIKLDASGNLFVDGFSSSSTLPQVNPFQSSFGGVTDSWVAELSPGGTTLLLSSFFGGSNQEFAYGLDLRDNQLYLTGTTTSQNFPVTSCAAVPAYNGASGDVFFAIVHLPAAPTQLVGAASRKVHGSAGPFDVDLPLTGSPGIECRSGGATGDYSVVFNFANPLTSTGCVNVTTGTGSVARSSIDSNDPHNYIVNLTGVTNAQRLTVNLSNVTDSAGDFSSAVSAQMGVLIGDVNASKLVDGNDVSAVQSHTRQSVNNTNFRYDVNASGLIDGNDVSITQGYTRTSLP